MALVSVLLLCGPLAAQSGGGQGTGGTGGAAAGSDGSQASGSQAAGTQAAGTQAAGTNDSTATGTGQAPTGPAPANQSPVPAAPSAVTPSSSNAAQTAAAMNVARSNAARAAAAKDSLPVDTPDTQHVNPYGDLPSLRELNIQVPLASGPLARFGSEAFAFGTGNVNELPMDLPVGPDYVLGPGDNIIVNMWGGHSERLSVTIDRQGQIALPEAGTISLDGVTLGQAQAQITKLLSSQYQDEHVEISLGRLRTVRVYVVGDAQRPGAYDVSSLSTPLSVLYAAGGPTARGSLRLLRQYRGTKLVAEIDLYEFLLNGVRSYTERLLPGDTIQIPAAGPEVTVEGMVHHPAIYELNKETSLSQVLDLAGGILATASLKQINVARIEAHTRRTMLSLELPNTTEAQKAALAGFRVQGGDDVVISQILPYNDQAVYLQGHVYRPGRYPYHEGMTVADLLHSYQDILPEPSDRAEIIRLVAPDYRPIAVPFNLRDVLIGNVSVPLQPFDVIRTYGRYEADAPTVIIEGQVLRPGTYPMTEGMTAAALVRMAGGFNRSAYRDTADVASYVVENGQKVLVNHSLVDIQKALDGDKQADVLLKPGDVVSIRQLAGWQDIGASVTVLGEVQHPGGYGLAEGERLSTVLKRAGGYRNGAYPEAAVLTRNEVRQLSEQAREKIIQRIETTPVQFKPGALSAEEQQTALQSMQTQRDQLLTQLRNSPPNSRLVINISSDISKWENTPADIELRAGDTLIIPKKPGFVLISGEVFNPAAISYAPGKDVRWYLGKGGGTTESADMKRIYILRADGSVVVHGTGWITSSILNARLEPGDSVVVPEKIYGGSQVWKDVIAAAQVISSTALVAAVAGAF